MSEFLKNLRKKLSGTVDGAWVGQLDAKDALEKIARDTGFASCLREAMEAGGDVKKAYADCAEAAGLAEAYRKLWGK